MFLTECVLLLDLQAHLAMDALRRSVLAILQIKRGDVILRAVEALGHQGMAIKIKTFSSRYTYRLLL